MLQARHREEIVAVRRFPHVHQVDDPLAVVPEIAGADFDAPRRPVMRVAGDAERPLRADRTQDVLGRLIGADELLDVQRDDVRVLPAADVILRDLGAGDDQQVIETARALRLRGDVGEIRLEPRLGDREVAPPERRHPRDPRQQILLHQDVVGDRDDVEASGLPVEIDDLAQRQTPIAPPRVDVEVAEQKRFVPRHISAPLRLRPSRRNGAHPPDGAAESLTRSSARRRGRPRPCPSPDSGAPRSRPSSRGTRRRARSWSAAAPGSCLRRETRSADRTRRCAPARRSAPRNFRHRESRRSRGRDVRTHGWRARRRGRRRG